MTELELARMTDEMNAIHGRIQRHKAEHRDQRLGHYTSSVGSILNAYREGDLTFDECEALLKPANPLRTSAVGDAEIRYRDHLRRCAQCARGPLCVEGRQLWADNGFQPAEMPASEIGSLAVGDAAQQARELVMRVKGLEFKSSLNREDHKLIDAIIAALQAAAAESEQDGAAKERERIEDLISWKTGSLADGDYIINAEAKGWNTAMQWLIQVLDAAEEKR